MSVKRYKRRQFYLKSFKFIYIIMIIIIIFSGVKIYYWIKENKQNKDIIENVSKSVNIDENIETVEKYNIDFEKLKSENPETIAWLKVNGTSIEYPILKTKNNDFYMSHSFNRTRNGAGWSFMDYRNKFDGTDKNIIIYAHNRRDGSMFGTLKNILTKEWYEKEENYIIPLISETEKAEYKVFSIYKIEKEDYYITTKFKDDVEFLKFIETLKSRSIKDFGEEVTNKDKILTLSTCADNNKYRVVLHAKKILE